MYKKLLVISISIALIFSFILLTKNDNNVYSNYYPSNHLEGSDFSSVEQAYFGEKIEFDATNYIGSKNEVKAYFWDFGDGNTAEGSKVQHSYNFENDYDLEYPIVYSVTVMAYDGYESISTTRLIELYPTAYTFFLDNSRLDDSPPLENREYVGTTSIFDGNIETTTFVLDKSVTIPESEWILTLYLEKPFLLKIKKITIGFFDENSNEIANLEENVGLFSYGISKKIDLKGTFGNEIEFKSIRLSFYGFTIGEKIGILYGGEKASQIVFDFS